MGSGHSQEDYDRIPLAWYETSLQSQCLLPDVGIDESLLKYSGLNSNTELQVYSNGLLTSVPGYIEKLGSSLGAVTSLPNAVGLGALVISMILEIAIKSAAQTTDHSYSIIRRVFGEEKASSVRDTMSEYLKRHRMFVTNEQRLREELRRLEGQLSGHLTILKNSLLYDGQMSSRGFKIWVNGASFHVQMLIHEARLDFRCCQRADYIVSITGAINSYLQDLDYLLWKYKTYKTSTFKVQTHQVCQAVYYVAACTPRVCYIKNTEVNCEEIHQTESPDDPCGGSNLVEPYINHVFSTYEPILALKPHFSNIKNNLNFLIKQHGAFILPSRT
ncbi:uncharacterized protein LOC108889753 [Lates japonicus]